jgi:hypothetical protein
MDYLIHRITCLDAYLGGITGCPSLSRLVYITSSCISLYQVNKFVEDMSKPLKLLRILHILEDYSGC